ncbi:TrkH family potassium uptake protein [Adhaeribacter radiodurans]|uniref:ATPase n=1 Tax=Adhaeribacter radiodurans TaxID=2745197 RepID=A0A7L7L201_9BACT|nr:potassium transporter TrkG [Adhaeribacter radiodurans]QMU26615.1 ATPase [Adhaeribacter radiodurans]
MNKFLKKVQELTTENRAKLLGLINNLLFLLSIVGLAVFIYDLGFIHNARVKAEYSIFYNMYALAIFIILTLRLQLINKVSIRKGWFWLEYLLILLLVIGLLWQLFSDHLPAGSNLMTRYFKNNFLTLVVIGYVFLIELSRRTLNFYHARFNPALLFIASFILLIFIGTGLLMLPRATVGGITLIDALFTSASAVCVTGLIVVDTATYFTLFGKVIILLLIQLGGLGIMTFTSFLGLLLQRRSSFQNQLFMQNLVNEESMGQTMHTIANIIKITLIIELTGALLIYFFISSQAIPSLGDRIGFALFHSVSAFCNAGFSTLTDGLYDVRFRIAYWLQLVIMALIVLGGIGFPVIMNLYRYGKQSFISWRRKLMYREPYKHSSHLLTVHTKLVLVTTGWLILGGTILFFITEYNNTLGEHTGGGKLIASLFGSITPRTAGFNTVDMTRLTVPTIMIYLLFMWIGASPASTGGGIKTTTFAVAIRNSISIAKGNVRLEMYSREIKSKSVRQAFAVMLLSLLVIGLATFLILLFDPQQVPIQVAFEAFSAYSTVGLSLGLTAKLSAVSKGIIVVTMLLGRVGTFTLIAGIITPSKSLNYQYPTESIIIT